MKKIPKFLKPTIILDKPITPNDIKPEVWNIIDTNKNYLVYYPFVISSSLISYKPSTIGYKFESRNTIYVCDWAPTLRIVSQEHFNYVRNNI
tara:strand:- start:39 stop:314 length:276 start_codon:yes stop_codon:yes gene_type:complete